MSVTCYPVAGKAKSFELCTAFAEGCRGQVVTDGRWRGGPSAFYGVSADNYQAWLSAKASGEPWFYIDNAFFDACRERYFRISKSRMQHDGLGVSDGRRFAALGVEIRPWRDSGTHVVLCEQSAHYMTLAGYQGNWMADMLKALKEITPRPIRVRLWSRDKAKQAAGLGEYLHGAWALVTYSSAAAVTAILAGVPAVVGTGAALPVATALAAIDDPLRSGYRERWASVLADHQWTREEMRNGMAWRMLNA